MDWYNIVDTKTGETVKNNCDSEIWIKLSSSNPAYIKAKNSIPVNDSKIEFDGVVSVTSEYDNDECYIVALSGGLNGERRDNKWENYLNDISKILNNLGHSWIIDINNDCCDDIFYLTIGFRNDDTE